MNETPKIETADNLRERVLRSKEKLRERRELGTSEDWSGGLGEYYTPIVGKPLDDPQYTSRSKDSRYPEKFPIYGVEKYILDRVTEKLKMKKPVVLVDFGGMRSISFLRIAKELEKDRHISRGDVVIVVTNLNFNPEGEHEEINKERIKFFNKYKRLVHFCNVDARELQKLKVQIGDKQVTIKGNVDYLHESWALTHGLLNDVDWPLLARTLSEDGELISASTKKDLHSSAEKTISYDERNQAHRLGVQNLFSMGLKKKDLGPGEANYDIFVK